MNKKYNTITKRRLTSLYSSDQKAFKRWYSTCRLSKTSQNDDLPSSQIKPRSYLISPTSPQLFAVIDTCSLVRYRSEFMEYVANLKETFVSSECPVKIIICLTVLEELDKCNRSYKKNNNTNPQQDKLANIVCNNANWPTQNSDIVRLTKPDQPPRMFMRFVEEEMRTSQVIIGDLDPHRKLELNSEDKMFEIVNKDDRILECCMRARAFIASQAHNSQTISVLISEDNVFKSKASTYMVPSYRWLEFCAKFKNFGLNNYAPTPLVPPRLLMPRLEIDCHNNSVDTRSSESDSESVQIVEEIISIN